MESLNSALGGVVDWVRTQPGIALLLLLTLNTLTLVLACVGVSRATRLARRQARMLRGTDGDSLERMLLDYADTSQEMRSQLGKNQQVGSENTVAIAQSLRRIGLVRFDAFPNIGGQQSFALALLDDSRNGIVLSGLHSRHEMRVYAKPVQQGKSSFPLSPEEERAISQAQIGKELNTAVIPLESH